MAYWNYRKMLKCGSHILLTKLVSLDELELAKVLLLSFFWSKKILFFSCFIKKFGLYSHFHPGSLESSCKALFVSYKWFNSLLLLTFPIKKKKKKMRLNPKSVTNSSMVLAFNRGWWWDAVNLFSCNKLLTFKFSDKN